MPTGYTRFDLANNIQRDKAVSVADIDGEFDAVVAAFEETGGHSHDGTTGEGGPITVIGPAQEFTAGATDFTPPSDNVEFLGSDSVRFQTLYSVNAFGDQLDIGTLTFGSDGYVSITYDSDQNQSFGFPDFDGEVMITDSAQTITNKTIGGSFYPEGQEQFFNDAAGIGVNQDKVGYGAGYRGIPQQFTFSSAYSVGYGTDFMALLDSGASVILRESTWFDGLSGIASQQQPQEGDIKVFRNIHTSNISFTCDVENCYIDGSGDNVASFELEPEWLCTAVWLATDTVVILGTDGISSIVNK